MWAYVEDLTVVEIHGKLPSNWRNYSNFFVLESNIEYLNQLGWYMVVDDTLPISNDLEEYHGEPVYTVDIANNVVRKKCEIIKYDDLPSDETKFAKAREIFLADLRSRRNEMLKESDWTQGVDIQEVNSAEWKDAWRSYRQALRDLPALYLISPNDTIIDSNMVDWPPAPKG